MLPQGALNVLPTNCSIPISWYPKVAPTYPMVCRMSIHNQRLKFAEKLKFLSESKQPNQRENR